MIIVEAVVMCACAYVLLCVLSLFAIVRNDQNLIPFLVFIVVKSWIIIWVMTLCSLVGDYQSFRGTSCHHLNQSWWLKVVLKPCHIRPTHLCTFEFSVAAVSDTTTLWSLYSTDNDVCILSLISIWYPGSLYSLSLISIWCQDLFTLWTSYPSGARISLLSEPHIHLVPGSFYPLNLVSSGFQGLFTRG
jgi:hypothetical protein